MSSCLATTSMSSDTAPSGGGASWAVAVPVVSCAAAKHSIVRARCARAHIGFVINVLASKVRRSGAAALGQVDETDLKREEVRGSGREDKRQQAGAPLRSLPVATISDAPARPRWN